jgi:hypothetical protein
VPPVGNFVGFSFGSIFAFIVSGPFALLLMDGFTKILSVGLSSGAPPADAGGGKTVRLLEDDLEKLVQMRFDA